jgi:outer membrane protein assembly factor BamB
LWSYKTAAGVASKPVVNEATGLVYVGGFDSRLRAIDLQSHQQEWEVEARNWFWTTPLVDGGVVYAGSFDHRVFAVDASTGAATWEQPFDTGAPIRSAPVMVDDRLIIVNREGEVFALNPETGQPDGDPLALESDVFVDPLLIEGDDGAELLVTTDGGDLVRIDPETLTVIQRQALGG